MTQKNVSNGPPRAQLKKELWAAVEDGDETTVKQIIEQDDTLINAKNSHHAAPLSKAVGAGQLEIVKLLVSHGAELRWLIHGRPNDLLGCAALFGRREVGQYLISIGFEATVLHAAGINDVKLLETLLEKNAAIGSKDKRSVDRPMHSAARAGSLGVLEFLVSKGEELDCKNAIGQTPLFLTSVCIHHDRRLKCAECLLQNGANPNIQSSYPGGTVLHRALIQNDLQFCHLLLEHGADPNEQDNRGMTALRHAVQKSQRLVKLVLDYKPDMTISDGRLTPLEYANTRGKRAIVELLEQYLKRKHESA